MEAIDGEIGKAKANDGSAANRRLKKWVNLSQQDVKNYFSRKSEREVVPKVTREVLLR